jgi:hypothetical protein
MVPMFAMAESAFLDDGSHQDQKDISADHDRRNETCWPLAAAASQHRTLSTLIFRRHATLEQQPSHDIDNLLALDPLIDMDRQGLTGVAKEDGVSFNHWTSVAIEQKIGVVQTAADLLKARAGKAKMAEKLPFLYKAR